MSSALTRSPREPPVWRFALREEHRATGASIEQVLPIAAALAAVEGVEHSVSQWLERGGAVDARMDDEGGATLLHLASQFGHELLAYMLVAMYGARVDLADASGRTALHWAAQNGEVGVASQLLLAGADTTLCDLDGLTALDIARSEGFSAVVDEILSANRLAVRAAHIRAALRRLRRVAPLVGRCALALRALHEQAMRRSYAPGGAGYVRCRGEFEAAADLQRKRRRMEAA